MKKCSKCGELKPLTEFQKHPQSKDGRRPDCKICFEAMHKLYRKRPEVRARIKRYMKEYQKNFTPERRQKAYLVARRATAKTPRMALWVSRNNAYNRRPSEDFITLDQLMAMWVAQNGKCALSGIAMTWQTGKTSPTSISLDRIDNSCGYSHDNVRLVCYAVNMFKYIMTDAQMLEMAHAIVDRAGPNYEIPLSFGA